MDQHPIRRQIDALEAQVNALRDSLALLPPDQREFQDGDLERLHALLAQLGALANTFSDGDSEPAEAPPDLAAPAAPGRETLVWSAERTTRLYAINTALSVTVTRAQAAHVVVDQALPALNAEAGVILLADGSVLSPMNVPHGGDWGSLAPLEQDASLFAEVARSAQSLWIETTEALRERFAAGSPWSDAAAVAAVPLIAEGRVLGVMAFRFGVPQSFTIADRAFVLVLAQQCAAALERVHLYEQVRRAAALEERNRLARDLHDSVSQALYAIVLAASVGRTNLVKDLGKVGRALENIELLTGAAQADLRALLFDLRTDSVARSGLVSALAERCAVPAPAPRAGGAHRALRGARDGACVQGRDVRDCPRSLAQRGQARAAEAGRPATDPLRGGVGVGGQRRWDRVRSVKTATRSLWAAVDAGAGCRAEWRLPYREHARRGNPRDRNRLDKRGPIPHTGGASVCCPRQRIERSEPMPAIEKALTGIEGFDDITYGGLPRARTTLVIGSPGSGKTVFALQTLVNGARVWHEPGIFVAFEENSSQIVTNAGSFGWDLEGLAQQDLFFLDARMSADTIRSGPFDLTGLLASLDAKAKEMGARRIVFDSIDVLLTLMNDPLSERQEIYRLHEWLSRSDLTGIITTRGDPSSPPDNQRFGFIQYTTDCIVQLATRVADRVALRELRVIKYRGSAFRSNEFPFVIGEAGIEVASFGIDAPEVNVSMERVSSGVERLDSMLNGGYLRGTSVLITGSPGTAKSSLAGTFAAAACARGERALLVSYDEAVAEVVRNLQSINVDLQRYIDSGLLGLYADRTESGTAEEHLIYLRNLCRKHQPRYLVVDPLSAIIKAGGQINALSVASRLLAFTKVEGITSLFTSLLEGGDPSLESSPLGISTIADTWIHLSYVVHGGERNRALTIIKSRGTRHSNQVRELDSERQRDYAGRRLHGRGHRADGHPALGTGTAGAE